MAKKNNLSYNEIPNMAEDWSLDPRNGFKYSGESVQKFIKKEFGQRFGYLNMRFNEALSMYYIECFDSEADYKLYEADKEANASLLLQNVQIPISTVSGDTFTATLRTSLKVDADVVVTGEELLVPLNYRSIKISKLGNENAYYSGTLVVQVSTDGKTWTDKGEIPNILTSRDDTETFENVNIGAFLIDGRQQVRLRATYEYVDEEGKTKVVNSGNVLVGNSVTKTQLKLTLKDSYAEPKSAKDVNNNAVKFNVNYEVQGQVKKTAYFKVTDPRTKATATTTYSFSEMEYNINRNFISDIAMTHGVKMVEAWIECNDGLGEGEKHTLKSEVLVNRFMVVTDANDATPYLLLQNVDGSIENFVRTELAEYAVYSKDTNAEFNLTFLLTDYTEGDYVAGSTKEYFRLDTKVKAKTEYSLQTTVEIEGEEGVAELDEYRTYFRVWKDGANFMLASTDEKNYQVMVDNRGGYTPVAGATFLMNPKVRNNNESDPKRILNAKNNNAVVASEWDNFGFINDGWMTDDAGNKVLRVMAGSKLTIKRNVWAQFMGTDARPASSITIEIDCAIHNVTNTTDPIIQMTDGTGSTFKGIRMNALEGWIMNGSNTNKDDCLFAWEEGKRVHFSFNLNHQVKPNKGDVKYDSSYVNLADGTIALARVLMNGVCQREIPYSTAIGSNEWGTNTDGAIVIGNEGADIDIYSIRIYENKVLDMVEIMNRNYLATLTSSDDKVALKERNALTGEGGLISLEETKKKGLNCMVWHGVLPYKFNSAEQTGWIEIFRYDADGNPMPEYSGTLCMETKSLVGKGQGTTAKTYYDWNLQDDMSKVDEMIEVALDKIHAEIKVSAPYTKDGKQYVDIYGGNLGKNAPIEIPENAQAYEYANGKVIVPDGWIDGNGMYRGMGYRVAQNTSLAQKKVIKINYASSMQSHLIGACTTYDLLHRKIVGDTPLQQLIPDAVSAKHTEPMMFFNEDGGKTYFKGMGNYGAGKADKVTWGYVKKQMPMYALIEGSDNDPVMTNFLVPFDKNTAVYSPADEGWKYNGQMSWDFDLGATTEGYSDGWTTDGTLTDKGKVEVPTALIRDKWADIHNFIYLHSTNLKYFVGTFEEFLASDKADDTKFKYWCTAGDEAFNLKRYDYRTNPSTGEPYGWINAGLLVNTSYERFRLNANQITKPAYERWAAEGSGDYSILNELFKSELVSHMRKYLKYFVNEKSLQFNYSYVLQFLAGTDNSAKNTYYKIDPIGVSMEEDPVFKTWFEYVFGHDFDFSSVHQLYLDGDDMDSILRTNNNAHQTKPYYIERMYPYADDKPNDCLYEGMQNQLFNYVERAYSGTGELKNMMNQIMIAMTQLVSADDKLPAEVSTPVSVWGFMHKYFFNIQSYFPEIAYLEQARIRYEFPQLLGYKSTGSSARGVEPITQSLGNQLGNELQYVNQRLIYFASYASFGEFGDTNYSIGLTDAKEVFSFKSAPMPDGSPAKYVFNVKTHQYMYPCWYETGTFYNSGQRTKPGDVCTLAFRNEYSGGDAGIGICGVNYLTDLGDLSDKSITGKLTINGKRLTSVLNMDNKSVFRPSFIEILATQIKSISLNPRNETRLNVNLASCVRCSIIKINGRIDSVTFPESSVLTEVSWMSFLRSIDLKNVPNLKVFKSAGNDYLAYFTSFHIGPNVGTNVEGFSVQPIVESIYTAQQSSRKLESIHIENVNWTDFDVKALEWYCDVPTCEFLGTIGIKETSDNPQITAVTWDLKNKIWSKFGLVDRTTGTQHKGLYLAYRKRDVTEKDLKISGNFYVESDMSVKFVVTPGSKYENTQGKIAYSIHTPPKNTKCYINSNTGVLTITSLSDVFDEVVIRAEFSSYSTVGYQNLSVEKTIEIWNRPAQVGDLVYADGTFSSVESYDGEKTPIGRCFYVAPKKDGKVNPKLANENDKWNRMMVACDDVYVLNSNSQQWGVYPLSSDASLIEPYSLYYMDGTDTKKNLSIDGVDIANIQSIQDITSSGLTKKNDAGEWVDTSYIDDASFRDTSDEGWENDGFRTFAQNTAMGDGFGAGVGMKGQADSRYLEGLATLAGEGYDADSIVNACYIKTLKVIQHRNRIIKHIQESGEGINGWMVDIAVPQASEGKSEIQHLGELITRVREWAKGTDEGQPAETVNFNKWSQLLYPAASACYAYEPTNLKDGEVLSPKFKAHNWALPTDGILARLFWYTYDGNGDSTQATAKENSPLNTVYADNGKILFKKLTSSSHWSVTEYGSHYAWYVYFTNGNTGGNGKTNRFVGRAVSAF